MSSQQSERLGEVPAVELCHSYTWARRMPPMIGRIKSPLSDDAGVPLVGGPYAVPQLVAAAASFLVLLKTREVWAPDNRVITAVVVLGVPLLLGFVVRRAHVDGRPILGYLAAVARYLAVTAAATVRHHSDRLRQHPIRVPGGWHAIAVTTTGEPPTPPPFPACMPEFSASGRVTGGGPARPARALGDTRPRPRCRVPGRARPTVADLLATVD